MNLAVLPKHRVPRCPTNPAHGLLLKWSGVDGAAWYCMNPDHWNGNPYFTERQARRTRRAM